MSRKTLSVIAGRMLMGVGFLSVLKAASMGSVAMAVPPVPEIDPASAGSVVSLLVGALALREGFARRRCDRE